MDSEALERLGLHESDLEDDDPHHRVSRTLEEFIRIKKLVQRHSETTSGVRRSKVDAGTYWANYYKSKRKHITRTSRSLGTAALVRNSETSRAFSVTSSGTSQDVEEEPGFDSNIQLNIVDDLERSDWENWWIKSPLWRRLNVLILLFLFVFGFVQVIFAIYLFSTYHFELNKANPYICKTSNCLRLSVQFNESMDNSTSPCDNFYQFVCGNYVDGDDTF
jgi:hypothetical protein